MFTADGSLRVEEWKHVKHSDAEQTGNKYLQGFSRSRETKEKEKKNKTRHH